MDLEKTENIKDDENFKNFLDVLIQNGINMPREIKNEIPEIDERVSKE